MDGSVLNAVGPALVLAFACIGSSVGCGIAGMASHAAISRVEENHGKFIGLAALPSSQAIYGIVMMMIMRDSVTKGTLSAEGAIGIAFSAGVAFLLTSIYQGYCVSTAIHAAVKKPAVLGKCCAAAGIVESFSLFTFVFSLLLL